jgi:NADH-quinone oxidoreductase subunit G
LEAAILNARIRKRYRADPHSLRIGLIGEEADLHYPYEYLGAGPETLGQIADGSHDFLKAIEGAERPMVIVGQGALTRSDGAGILAMAAKAADAMGALTKDWNGFNLLHTVASRAGALDLGFVPGKGGKDVDGILNAAEKGDMEVVYLLGADELEVERLGNAFVIYQGSHGDRGAHRADVILPGAAYTEKDALYVNTEGRPQSASRAIFPPGDAREDWKIVRALSAKLGKTLPYDSLAQLRSKMFADHPHLALLGTISPAEPAAIANLAKTEGKVTKAGFKSPIADFYLTNPIARASAIMAQLSAMHAGAEEGATGTDG